MKFILIRFFFFHLTFPMKVQYKGNSFIFQHEVKGKYLRGEDEDEDCDKDEDDSVIQFFK